MAEPFEWHSAEQNNPVNCFARGRQRSHARPAVQRGGSGGVLLYYENGCVKCKMKRNLIKYLFAGQEFTI